MRRQNLGDMHKCVVKDFCQRQCSITADIVGSDSALAQQAAARPSW